MKKAPDSERRRVCALCAKEFFVKPSEVGKYCSRQCKNDGSWTRPRNTPRPCVVCSKIFTPNRGHGEARHCSKHCEWVSRGGKEFSARVARETAQQRGDQQRGKGSGKGYRKLNGRHEHRVVAEKIIGRPLQFVDVVHHKDGNKLNNDPSNLEVLTRAAHMREHGLGLPGVAPKHKPWEARWGKK